MKKALSLSKFSVLMIATLADNSKYIDFVYSDKKVAVIPNNYKQRIENILCSENGWRDEFSILINTDKYFEDHFEWEQELATNIKNILNILGKKYEYDFISDSINITFSQKEVDLMLSKFKDENVKKTMNHFVSLLGDYIYSREYQEEFHDYSSRSVQYMKSRKNNKIYNEE